jgi:hypothetical protein
LAEQHTLLTAHQTAVAENEVLREENVALREELTRVGGADWRNRVERSLTETERLRAEQQQLRDEVARLKGEQGRPRILQRGQHSSEAERRQPRGDRRRAAREAVRIDRTETRAVEEPLPPDAAFKGYAEVVVQDIRLETDNVCFRLAACRREAKGFAFGTVWYRGKGEAGVESVRQRTGRGDDEPAVYQCGL